MRDVENWYLYDRQIVRNRGHQAHRGSCTGARVRNVGNILYASYRIEALNLLGRDIRSFGDQPTYGKDVNYKFRRFNLRRILVKSLAGLTGDL